MPIFEELPKPPQETQIKKNHDSQWQFAAVLNGFTLAYHVLHKFLMPLFVIYTSSLPVRVEKIDWWWVYHAVLAVFLVRRQTQSHTFRVVVFAGFGGLTVQCLQSFVGLYWHSFSLWLTAASTLAVLIYVVRVLPKIPLIKSLALATLGCLLGAGIASGLYFFYDRKPVVLDLRSKTDTALSQTNWLKDPPACGVDSFALRLQNGQIVLPSVPSLAILNIESCGLPYPLQIFSSDKLRVVNHTANYMNLKMAAWDESGWRVIGNVPLLAHGQDEVVIAERERVIQLFSDSNPAAGTVLILKSPEDLQRLILNYGFEKALQGVLISKQSFSPIP